MGEGAGEETSSRKINAAQQSNKKFSSAAENFFALQKIFSRCSIFVVHMTTEVLKYQFPRARNTIASFLAYAFGSFTRRSDGGPSKMETGRLAFTAVYLKSNSGYIGFIEELPGVNSHGRTIDEARETLQKLAAVVFDEERRGAEELIAGKDVVRESFFVPIPRPA
jgi:predicted RNase H-like HicB family nuclease